MTLWDIKNLNETTKIQLELILEFNITEYKIKANKSAIYLYSNSKPSEKLRKQSHI